MRVGLLSDTHSYLDPQLTDAFSECDVIWHAGDVGNFEVYRELQNLKKHITGVYGNIDGTDIRLTFPREQIWDAGGMKIYMVHIGGYPDHYPAQLRSRLAEIKPDIFICGHSHILKVIYDKAYQLLHLNPGAAGYEGFHKVRTAIRFSIDDGKVLDMQVLELGSRSIHR
ncbi:MAG: metallophosphatase family protein [Bacteroidota bacterium]|nr:metallophosphatase family protein [Bacteroidota bacterium]